MVVVFQAQRRTTSLAPLEKDVLDKLQIQLSLPLLKLIKSIRLCKKKFKLIYIYAMAILNLSKTSFKKNLIIIIMITVKKSVHPL